MEADEPMAYCGLTCGSCPIYLATRETDKAKQVQTRIEIAEFASKHYDTVIKPEDLTDCDGCKSQTGRLYSGCSQCGIRNCAQAKDCLTCAHCPEYPCDRLQKFFASDPGAKVNLDSIRNNM